MKQDFRKAVRMFRDEKEKLGEKTCLHLDSLSSVYPTSTLKEWSQTVSDPENAYERFSHGHRTHRESL